MELKSSFATLGMFNGAKVKGKFYMNLNGSSGTKIAIIWVATPECFQEL